MRTVRLFLASLALAVLAGCSGSGAFIKPVDLSKASPIYIAPIENDYYDMAQRISMIVARAGFDPVKNEDARFKLVASYHRTPYKIEAYVKIFDQTTGEKIYQGEGQNNGFGTMIAKREAILGTFETALQGLGQ